MYKILELNPQLAPFSSYIDERMALYQKTKKAILPKGSNLCDFANAHEYFGFHHVKGGWYYREWAPSAKALYLILPTVITIMDSIRRRPVGYTVSGRRRRRPCIWWVISMAGIRKATP